MKYTLLIICIICFMNASLSFADPEPPCVNAILRITLRDNSAVEGVLQIASPGHNHGSYYDYLRNGMYYQLWNVTKIIPFDVDLDVFKFEYSALRVRYTFGQKAIDLPDDGTLYYLQLLYIPEIEEETFKINEEEQTLLHERLLRRKYQMLTYIPLRNHIPNWLYSWQETDTEDMIKIPVTQIQKIEFVKTPSDKWIQELTVMRHTIQKRIQKEKIEYEAYDPVWVHEIIQDEQLFHEYIKRMQK